MGAHGRNVPRGADAADRARPLRVHRRVAGARRPQGARAAARLSAPLGSVDAMTQSHQPRTPRHHAHRPHARGRPRRRARRPRLRAERVGRDAHLRRRPRPSTRGSTCPTAATRSTRSSSRCSSRHCSIGVRGCLVRRLRRRRAGSPTRGAEAAARRLRRRPASRWSRRSAPTAGGGSRAGPARGARRRACPTTSAATRSAPRRWSTAGRARLARASSGRAAAEPRRGRPGGRARCAGRRCAEPGLEASWARDLVDAPPRARHGSPTTTSWPGCCAGCSTPGARRGLGADLPRRRRATTSRLWTDAVQRAPDPWSRRRPRVLAFAAWQAGHGALAWCARRPVPGRRRRQLAGRAGRPRCSPRRSPPSRRGRRDGVVELTGDGRRRGAVGTARPWIPARVGVEEELLLVDPATREPWPRGAREVLKEFREHGPRPRAAAAATDELDQELFRHQLETRTDPTRDVDDAFAQLVAARRTAGEAARCRGLAVGACGIGAARGATSRWSRTTTATATWSRRSARSARARRHLRDARARRRSTPTRRASAVIDRIAPWLPVLLALSANSPYRARGATPATPPGAPRCGPRWPSAGPTEPFGSLDGLPRAPAELLLDSGAARDPGMLYFDARLVRRRTRRVEVRVLRRVHRPDGRRSLLAALVRALVETAAADWRPDGPLPRWRAEALRARTWRASRFGLAEPPASTRSTRELRPAARGASTRCVERGRAARSTRPATSSGSHAALERGARRQRRDPAAGGVRADRHRRGRRRRPDRSHRTSASWASTHRLLRS